MSLIDKKYFSIKEVSDITGIPAYKLRYLEKSTSKIDVFQVRGRRYYTIDDINVIKEKFGILDKKAQISPPTPITSSFTAPISLIPTASKSNDEIISRIDSLIAEFTRLEKSIRSSNDVNLMEKIVIPGVSRT